MLSDDQRRLDAILTEHDPKVLLGKIFDFWSDEARVERMPMPVLLWHFGILTSIAMTLLDTDLPVTREARQLAQRVLGVQGRPRDEARDQ